MLQFLPMIMNLLSSRQKDAEARNQNSAAAMLGQAPTAQGGDTGGALGGMMGSMLQKKAPGAGSLQKIEHGDTNKMLDEGLGKMDGDADDEDLLSM